MSGPAWLADVVAGVMIATAGYCLGRMAAARRWQRLTSYLLACGAMAYMVLSVVPPGTGAFAGGIAMGGPGATAVPGAGHGIPALALGLAVGLLGYTVWTTDRLTSLGRVAGGQAKTGGQVTASLGASAPAVLMSARLSACCDIVMGVTMGYMLITML